MINKERILQVIRRLPEDVSIADVVYALQFWEKVGVGIRQADAGELISHEEIEREFCGPDSDG
jgi:predicted transcriptional regulator